MSYITLNLKTPTVRCLRLLERELIWFTLLVPILSVVSFLLGNYLFRRYFVFGGLSGRRGAHG